MHLGLRLGYVPALAYGSCRVSDQGTSLRASDLHNARATILNPFNNTRNRPGSRSLRNRHKANKQPVSNTVRIYEFRLSNYSLFSVK